MGLTMIKALPLHISRDITSAFDTSKRVFHKFWQITLKLNDACSMRCKHCTQYSRVADGTYLSFCDICNFSQIVQESGGTSSFLLTGGEPLIHPEIRQIAMYFAEHLLPFDINTGLLIATRNLEYLLAYPPRTIRYSFQGTTQKQLDEFMGRQAWDIVLQNAKFVSNNKHGRYMVEILYNVTKENFRNLPQDITWLLETLNPDDICICPVFDHSNLQLSQMEVDEFYDTVLPSLEVVPGFNDYPQLSARARTLFGDRYNYTAPHSGGQYSKTSNSCHAGASILYVDNFGDIYTCVSHQVHRSLENAMLLGNVRDTSTVLSLLQVKHTPCMSPSHNNICSRFCPLFFSYVNEYVNELARRRLV